MKKILSLALSFALALALFVPRTAVFAEGSYNEHTNTIKFKDDTHSEISATTRVQYSLEAYTFNGKQIPVVRYVFTYNPEFSVLKQRPLVGFVLPKAVGVPLRIHKQETWKTGNVIASPKTKTYEGEQIIPMWLDNDASQDYGSKLIKWDSLTRQNNVQHEAYKQKQSHKQIYDFKHHLPQIMKAYENYHFHFKKDADGYNKLKEYLEKEDGANQIFASWESFDNANKYIFTVVAPLRDPNNPENIIDNVDRINDEAVKKLDLTALAYISSKNSNTAKLYRISGIKATVEDMFNAKDEMMDSDRNDLASSKKVTLFDGKYPVVTTTDKDFDDEKIKEAVLVYGGGETNKEVTSKPDKTKVGSGNAKVTVNFPDNSKVMIDVPTLSISKNEGLGDETYNNFVKNEYSKLNEIINHPENLKLSDKKLLEEVKKYYEAIRELIPEKQQKLGDSLVRNDIDKHLAKIADWEEKIDAFKKKYKEIYDKTGVDVNDEVKITEALEELSRLDQQVQDALANEKAKLENKKAAIEAIKQKADEFNKKYADNVTDENSEKYAEALDGYKKLTDEEKKALKDKNSKLANLLETGKNKEDSIKNKDEADKFKQANNELLEKETVTIEDEEKIEKLKEDYDSLSNGVKNALGDEVKDKIDALGNKLKELKKTKYEFIKDQDKIKVKVIKYVKDKDTGKGKLEETIRDIELKDADNSIIIVQEPTKKAYKVGEKFDPVGLKIKLVDKEAGESEEITHDKFEANNISLKLDGDKEITTALTKTDTKVIVKYGDKQAEVNITVTEEGVGKPSEPAPAPSPAPAPQPKPNVPAPSLPAPSKPSTPIAPKEDNNIFKSEPKDKVENQKQNSKDKVPNTRATQTAGVMLTISLAAACLLNKKRK